MKDNDWKDLVPDKIRIANYDSNIDKIFSRNIELKTGNLMINDWFSDQEDLFTVLMRHKYENYLNYSEGRIKNTSYNAKKELQRQIKEERAIIIKLDPGTYRLQFSGDSENFNKLYRSKKNNHLSEAYTPKFILEKVK